MSKVTLYAGHTNVLVLPQTSAMSRSGAFLDPRACAVKVDTRRLPVFLFFGLLNGCKGHKTHRFENRGANQLRKTGNREVVLCQPLPQTLYKGTSLVRAPTPLDPTLGLCLEEEWSCHLDLLCCLINVKQSSNCEPERKRQIYRGREREREREKESERQRNNKRKRETDIQRKRGREKRRE